MQRGERGSTEEHLTVTQFKVQSEQERLETVTNLVAQVEQTLEDTQAAADRQKEKTCGSAKGMIHNDMERGSDIGTSLILFVNLRSICVQCQNHLFLVRFRGRGKLRQRIYQRRSFL